MLPNGKILDGRYLIREQIGRGGFGAVYLAEDTRFSGNNRIAIKQIESNNETVAKSSKIEADLLYNLNHPNLPKVTNCFLEEGSSFIVMDYISGEDLAQKLSKKKKLEIEEVLQIADKVLDALEYLHSFPIFHRDVKPHNIKVDEKGGIFLLDFGTAKGNLAEEEKTVAFGGQSITGYTPFYAPLEQVLRVDPNSFLLLNSLDEEKLRDFSERKTDARSDVYATGATVYHLLTGFSPEQATSTVRAYSYWSNKPDPLPNIRTLNEEVAPALAGAIHRALEVLPELRFQTATEFRQSLRNSQAASVPTKPAEANHHPNQFQNQSHLAPTRRGPQIIEIKENSSPPARPPSINVVPEGSPREEKSKARVYALLGIGAILLLVLGVSGAFLAWKYTAGTPGELLTDGNKPPVDSNQNGAVGNQNAVPNLAKKENVRNLDYWLLVQKMRGGKKFQEPFASSGQEIFENGYQFEMHLSPSEKGFLYIFAEGLSERGEKMFNLIFPTPLRNNGVPEVAANQTYQTGWNEFGGAAGTEKFWLVWSREKPEAPENARESAFRNRGKIADQDLQGVLKDYLEKNKQQKTAFKDAERKLSRIEFADDSMVYLIELEHR